MGGRPAHGERGDWPVRGSGGDTLTAMPDDLTPGQKARTDPETPRRRSEAQQTVKRISTREKVRAAEAATKEALRA